MPFFNWIFITFPFRRLPAAKLPKQFNNRESGVSKSVQGISISLFCWPCKNILLKCFQVLVGLFPGVLSCNTAPAATRKAAYVAQEDLIPGSFLHSRFLHFFMMIKSYLNVSYVYDNVVPVVAFWRKLPEIEKILWNGKVSPKSFSLGNEMFILNGFNCV